MDRASPSAKAKTLTSVPASHSSTTTASPASPKMRSSMQPLTARTASSVPGQRATPLPAARPSALITTGEPCSVRKLIADVWSRNTRYSGPGTPASRMTWRAKLLLASIRAAAREGPKAGMPTSARRSTNPSTRGCSGPTTTRSAGISRARVTTAGTSSGEMATLVARRAVPELPPATHSSDTRALSLSRQARACSLPPEPTIRTFTGQWLRNGLTRDHPLCLEGVCLGIGVLLGPQITGCMPIPTLWCRAVCW